MSNLKKFSFFLTVLVGFLVVLMIVLSNTLDVILLSGDRGESLELSLSDGNDQTDRYYAGYLTGLIISAIGAFCVAMHLMFGHRLMSKKFSNILSFLLTSSLVIGGVLMIFYLDKLFKKINQDVSASHELIEAKNLQNKIKVQKDKDNITVLQTLGYLTSGLAILVAGVTDFGILSNNF